MDLRNFLIGKSQSFADLNGTWNDPDGDGKYSEHPTGVEPDLWVGGRT